VATAEDAVAQLQEYAALSAAEAPDLFNAVTTAAQQEAIDLIADDALVPASVADVRVARVARICAQLGRLRSPTEVAVVLRVPTTTARSTISRLRALYRGEVETWAKALIAAQVASVEDASSEALGERWRITFNDPSALDYSVEMLRREGMTRDIDVRKPQQTLTVPKRMRDRRGEMRDAREVLGV